MPLSDAELRAAAADFIADATLELPIIGLARHAVDQGLGELVIEISVGIDGPRTTILFTTETDEKELVALG